MKTNSKIPMVIAVFAMMVMINTLQAGNPGNGPDSRRYPAGTAEETPYVRHHVQPGHSESDFNTRNEFYMAPGTVINDPFNLVISEINGRDIMIIPVNHSTADAAISQYSGHLKPGKYNVTLIDPRGAVRYNSFLRID